MQIIFLIIFALIPSISFCEEFDLTPIQEDLIGLEKTSSLPDEVPLFIGKVGENNIPQDFVVNDEEIDVVDIIKTTQAANKKEDNDELVFYNYEDEEAAKNDISKMAASKKISGTVQKAIDRELKKEIKDPPILDRNQLMAAYFAEDAPEIEEEENQTNATIKISILDIKINEGEAQKNFDFEFVPEYDSFNSISDVGSGTIELREPLNSAMGIIRGAISKRDFVRTKVDLSLEKKEKFIEIPLINQEYFEFFLEKNKISGAGAFVLLDLHESIRSVELEANYETKIFLNENFKQVPEGKERYVLFFGVTPGNVLLQTLNANKEIGQKIIHINEGEIYFDQLGQVPGMLETVELYEKNLLGKVNTELNIDGKDLKILNSDYVAKNIGINRYEFFRPTFPTGTRKYFELTHQGEAIFLGLWHSLKVELPDRDFRAQIMYQLNLKGLQESCLIHANFSKPVAEFKAFGEGSDDGIDLEIYYLGRDGLISSEIVDNTTKAFVVGNLPGVINGTVKYIDGTKDFFQSPCSQNSYLVEQF
jgi:hypothetical protein